MSEKIFEKQSVLNFTHKLSINKRIPLFDVLIDSNNRRPRF